MSKSLAGTIADQFARRMGERVRKWTGQHRGSPWMRPYEQDLILDVVRALQPKRCLEWGGGLSTVQFPALLPQGARWLTIEHDKAWSEQLATLATHPAVTVRFVPPDVPGFTGDGDTTSFASYLAAADADAPYDLIFIDGRARAAGVERAQRLLAPDGVVILHDANRDAYLAGTKAFAQQALFRDHRRGRPRAAGGVWLGSPQRNLATLVDLDFHQRVFAFYRGAGQLLA